MGNLHLVTGRAGTAHVTSADQGSFNAAVFGEGNYVLHRGSRLATTVISNNTIRIADGDIVMQGRHIRLNEGSYVDLTIENGQQGMVRHDLIVARYTKDGITGIEDCNLVVIKGNSATGTATDPEYTIGDIINDHVLIADAPLYSVPLDGLNVQTPVALFEEANVVKDGSVSSKKLANSAVSSSKIANKAVTKGKLAAGATYNSATVSLAVASWSGNAQTVSADGVTASNLVIVAPSPDSYSAYSEANVRCTAQDAGKLTFVCDDVPSVALTVNITMPV